MGLGGSQPTGVPEGSYGSRIEVSRDGAVHAVHDGELLARERVVTAFRARLPNLYDRAMQAILARRIAIREADIVLEHLGVELRGDRALLLDHIELELNRLERETPVEEG